MKKTLQRLLLCFSVFLSIPSNGIAQNIFSGEPVQVVGSFNGYSTTPYNSDYRTTGYRKVSTTASNPSDGRGQWATTINVQSSGGNVTPVNMTGGGGNGFLFISGPSSNRFLNKWVFSGVGQGSLNTVNGISAFNSGNDMGLNMSTVGRYTFVFNDAGYTQTNAKYYVGFTSNNPVNVSNGGVTFSNGQPIISITTSANPSTGENIYVRYRVSTNDFTSSTSVVQATGSGTNWTAILPAQTCGSTVFYYVYTSTRTLSQINSDSESDRSLTVLRYDDNFGSNFSFSVSPVPTAGITNNSGTTVLSCEQQSISATATGGVSYLWNGGSTPNTASNTFTTAGTYNVVVTAANGCTNSTSITITGVVTPQTDYYVDNDGDGFGTGTPVSTCANPNPALYVTVNGDCDDSNNTIYPGATEICWNNVLENCSGTMSQGCAPIVVNMATANGSTLPSFATAVSAFNYDYPGASSIQYRFSFKNNQTNVTEEVIAPTRFATVPVSIRNYNVSYDVRVSAVINGELVPYAGNTITVLSPVVAMAKLSANLCNTNLTSINSTLSSTVAFGATNYTFRIRLTSDNGPEPTYGYTNPSASRFTNTNSFVGFPLQYNTSYSVAIQYEFIDIVTGLPTLSGYGEECTITTPAIPVVSLNNSFCGSNVTSLGVTLSSQPASGALQYEFRIRLTSDNGMPPAYYYTIPSASRFSSLSAFQGITIDYVTQYSISVRYKILHNGSEVWSNFGPECTITTPSYPVTEIQPTQCGISGVVLDQTFNIVPFPGFPNYRITLFEQVGEDLVPVGAPIIRTVPNFKLNMFPGAQLEKNYSAAVSIQIGGSFREDGKSCDISTMTVSEMRFAKVEPSVVSFPNPFSDTFSLAVNGFDTNSNISVKVYDLLGRLVEQHDSSSDELNQNPIGVNLPSGVFNVIVTQNDTVKTLKVIKR